jgi:hypothetical protein
MLYSPPVENVSLIIEKINQLIALETTGLSSHSLWRGGLRSKFP